MLTDEERHSFRWSLKEKKKHPYRKGRCQPCTKIKEVEIGQKVEMEYGLGKKMARKIAKDHIKEFPCYYSKGLIPMERRLKTKSKREVK